MPSWNAPHYARAQEFTRLLAEALRASSPAAPPPPLVAPAPVSPAPAALPVEPPPAAPTAVQPATAASVFKKIPWKK